MAEDDALDGQIRKADPDRWLASRLIADERRRADVLALYGLNLELSRAAQVASQPLVGEMRLAWWGEAVAEICEGRRVRVHPVAQALEQAVGAHGLPRAWLELMIDARLRDLDPQPMSEAEVEPYLDDTAGLLMALAARVLSPGAGREQVRSAGRAWALAGLSRIGGRLPADWSKAEVARKVGAARRAANAELSSLPVDAFPAVAYAALAPAYARGREPGELKRRWAVTWASLRGRI
jgi:phytoene synthase